MARTVIMTLTAVALSILSLGCGRLISEGVGEARGASGKVVVIGMTPHLATYKALTIERITVAPGLQTPSEMPAMIGMELAVAAQKRGLMTEGQPGLKLSAQIVHYESSSTVDTAIGPLEEVVVRAKLTDASGNVVAAAQLVGRSKATSSSGARNLSEGVGKALDKWLKDGGLKTASDKDKD